MTTPDDPRDSTYVDPVGATPLAPDEVTAPPAPADAASPAPVDPDAMAVTPASPEPGRHAEESDNKGAGRAATVAALLAGAAALANKVREEAPKKVQEFREKRVAGRCVILGEVAGREVAIGPYRDAGAAREDTGRVPGSARVVELMSQTAYFGSPDSESQQAAPASHG
jgi:hypothetical protein